MIDIKKINIEKYLYIIILALTLIIVDRVSNKRKNSLIDSFFKDTILSVSVVVAPEEYIPIQGKKLTTELIEVIRNIDTIENKTAGSYTEQTFDLKLEGKEETYGVSIFKNRGNSFFYIILYQKSVSITYSAYDPENLLDAFFLEYIQE